MALVTAKSRCRRGVVCRVCVDSRSIPRYPAACFGVGIRTYYCQVQHGEASWYLRVCRIPLIALSSSPGYLSFQIDSPRLPSLREAWTSTLKYMESLISETAGSVEIDEQQRRKRDASMRRTVGERRRSRHYILESLGILLSCVAVLFGHGYGLLQWYASFGLCRTLLVGRYTDMLCDHSMGWLLMLIF